MPSSKLPLHAQPTHKNTRNDEVQPWEGYGDGYEYIPLFTLERDSLIWRAVGIKKLKIILMVYPKAKYLFTDDTCVIVTNWK